ncbi:MAG: lipid-A-disaccharide synthase, partial [Gemmatimonadota bacterium]|nr:lipid-A-disaccharide synthase [Gemmatimonadota bacterium]
EAALAGLPFAMAYRTHPLTYMLAKRLVRVPHIALANLVAGRQVVPEFVQGELVPEAVADVLLPLLDRESPERRDMLEGLSAVRGALGRGGAAKGVVDLVEDVLVERGTLRQGGDGVPR